MRIALIGGGGFIGHHLARELFGQGHAVLVCDPQIVNNTIYVMEMEDGHRKQLYTDILRSRWIEHPAVVHNVDARDYQSLSRVLRAWGIDVIVHMAAIAHIDRAHKDAHHTFEHSLRTLENALDVGEQIDIRRFIYFSSSTVYGDFISPTIDETDVTHNWDRLSIYGGVKLAGEVLVNSYIRAKGYPATIVRPCAAYGPRCISGRVVQKFIEGAMYDGEFTIFGDGEEREDFTYVDDIVAGVLSILATDRTIGKTYNLSAGQGRSLNDLARYVRLHFPAVAVKNAPKDNLKPSRGTMSVSRLMGDTGWAPQVDLETGIAKYVAWYREFENARVPVSKTG